MACWRRKRRRRPPLTARSARRAAGPSGDPDRRSCPACQL
jgi:hypothetical protein